MLEVVKQRESIENFINFVGSFLVTEDATIREIELVEANLKILKKRIDDFKNTTVGALWKFKKEGTENE
jgi:hypothetical protein